jgi:hypothetical protein
VKVLSRSIKLSKGRFDKKKFLSEENRRINQVNWPNPKSKSSLTLSIRWIVLQSQSGVGRSKLTCEERSRSENIPESLQRQREPS